MVNFMYNYEKLINYIKNLNCDILLNEPMYKHTSFKIGGNADLFLIVKDEVSLIEILKLFNKYNVPFFIIGNGSNLLVKDDGIRGAVIKLDGEFNEIELMNEDTIKCGSAVLLSKLCNFAMKNALSGIEFAYGIPGTVGGAVCMNAGAYGGEVKDVISLCTHVKRDGTKEVLSLKDLKLGYRKSIYTETKDIITFVIIKLKKGNSLHIKENMKEILQRRKDKQPLEYPSAGSVFKRPHNNFAGTLIEKCDLKGKSFGDAEVSLKHAGFIVNKGHATCQDVLKLISFIQKKVQEETGVILECEVKAIGDDK